MDKHIINTISKYKIIGLGENSHLTDFPIVYRLKLFKELAINYNYNVICLENDIFYTSIINAYIHSKIKTDPQILVENLFGETPSDSGILELEGNIIEYEVVDGIITLRITDSDGNTTVISLPIGSFTF